MNSELLQTCEELVKLMTKGIALKVERTRAGASNKTLKAFRTNGTKKAKAISAKRRRRQKQVAITTPSISNSPPTKFTLLELNREPSRGRIQRKKRGKRSLVKIIKLLLQMRNDLLSIGNTSRSKSKRKFMKSQSLLKKNENIKHFTSKSAIEATGIIRRRARLSSPKRVTSEISVSRTPTTDPSLKAPRGRNDVVTKVARADRGETRAPPANETRDRAHVIVAKGLDKAGDRNVLKRRRSELHKTSTRLDINRMSVIKSAKSTLDMSSETPPRKSMSLRGNTSTQKGKQVRRQIQTGISTRNHIKIGNVYVGSSSPIRDISLLKLNQDVNKFSRHSERRSGKRNHNVSRKFIMPPKPLTRILGQEKPASVKKLEAKSTKKINCLR